MDQTVKELVKGYIERSKRPVFEPLLVAKNLELAYVHTYNALIDLEEEGFLKIIGERKQPQQKPTPLYMKNRPLAKILEWKVILGN